MKVLFKDFRVSGDLSASKASHSLGCSMINCDIYIYMAMSDRTYVSNTHAHVRMSV